MILPLSSFGASTYVHPERVDIGAPKRSERLKTKGIGQKEKGENSFFSVFPALLCLIPLVFSRLFPKGRHESAAFVRMHPPAPYASKLMSAKKESEYAARFVSGCTLRSR